MRRVARPTSVHARLALRKGLAQPPGKRILERPLVRRPSMSSYTPPETPAKQLADFIAKFDPPIRKLARQCRAVLRKRMPTAIELVYDNFQALAIGYCPTERMSDCILSLAIFPRGVSLSFFYGATLPDPDGVLEGSGN